MLRFVSHLAANFSNKSPTLVRICGSGSNAMLANVGMTIVSKISSSYADLQITRTKRMRIEIVKLDVYLAHLPIVVHYALQHLQCLLSDSFVLHVEKAIHKGVQFLQPLRLCWCNFRRFILHQMHD